MPDTSDQNQSYRTGARITPASASHYVDINNVLKLLRGHRIAAFLGTVGVIGLAGLLGGLFDKDVPINYEWAFLSLFVPLAVIYESVCVRKQKKALEKRSIPIEEHNRRYLESFRTGTSTPGRELLGDTGVVTGTSIPGWQLLGDTGVVPMLEYRRKIKSSKWHYCRNCSHWPGRNYDTSFTKPRDWRLCNECRTKQRSGNCQY